MITYVHGMWRGAWWGGDWNFAPAKADRWCKDTGSHTGHKDARDAACFKYLFQAPGHEKLTELE